MVDKIIVVPEGIRGLGNIIIPKTLSDYNAGINSNISSKEESIDEINNTIYELNYYITPVIVINSSSNFIPFVDGAEVQVPIRVLDGNNNPVQDVRVDWEVDNDFHGHLITNSNGNSTFEYLLYIVNNQKVYSFDVEFEIAATVHNPKVTNSVTVITGCTLTLARTGYVEE